MLPDMAPAVARLRRAAEDGETIGVFGDFDIDGISGTAVVIHCLRTLGATAIPYVPDRVDEGHGLNDDALRLLAGEGVSVLVTVDCGAGSEAEIAVASELGIDCIVTDHHTMFDPPPYPVEAMVNPERPDSTYPFDHLTGVGMAYKLVQALFSDVGVDEPSELLELVALGTVGDVGSLVGENRFMVREGLRRMSRTSIPGLRALIDVAGYGGRELDVSALSFGLIPLLNAPGRLDDAGIALTLLTATEFDRARGVAALMRQYNEQRQALTHTAVDQAESQVRKRWGSALPGVLMVGHKDWKPGILGLVASRLSDKYGRPAIAVSVGEAESRASARSRRDFDILEVLTDRSNLFLRYGGHQQAAGFTIPNENLRLLADGFEAIPPPAHNTGGSEPSLDVDLVIGPSKVASELFEFTGRLSPFGEGNPQPLFAADRLRVVESRPVGSGRHLKLRLDDGQSVWDAIAFRQGDRAALAAPVSYVDVAYTMELNSWRGRTSLQLVIEDFAPSQD